MPAAAVASLTPAIAGMAGKSVGASGETVVDIWASGGREMREALCIISVVRTGEGSQTKAVVPAQRSFHSRGQDDNKQGPGSRPGRHRVRRYFLLASTGLAASGFAASGFAAFGAAGVLAAWSIRSILAPARSFAT